MIARSVDRSLTSLVTMPSPDSGHVAQGDKAETSVPLDPIDSDRPASHPCVCGCGQADAPARVPMPPWFRSAAAPGLAAARRTGQAREIVADCRERLSQLKEHHRLSPEVCRALAGQAYDLLAAAGLTDVPEIAALRRLWQGEL